MSDKIRLRLTIQVEYDADPADYLADGEEVPEGYTLEEYMCEIDKSNIEDAPDVASEIVDEAMADNRIVIDISAL